MALERTVKNKNVQEKQESNKSITNYAPPKGINNKQLESLITVCLKLDDSYIRQKEKSARLQRMAQLARAGEKESKEFKDLDREFKNPTVIDCSNEWTELHKIMSKIKKQK